MVFDRPQRPTRPNPAQKSQASQRPNSPATAKGNAPRPRQQSQDGGSRRNSGGNGGGDRPEQPSPWLGEVPEPDPSASFVEYLRWMREPDHPQKDATKVHILQMSVEGDYRDRLSKLNERTKLIAGKDNWFEVHCPWRIRVGGHRGPESILLPAFDALGMPYIPSSTLRGVARTQAIWHFMDLEGLTWKEAERKVASYFGALDADKEDQAGKVIFLDAYPIPRSNRTGGLAVDMANNIWSWKEDSLKYAPNPSPFVSIIAGQFLIGIRRGCKSLTQLQFEQVKQWLIAGLSRGVGSQINSGYGQLKKKDATGKQAEFFRVEFSLEGQLIHGYQKFTHYHWNQNRMEWQMRGQAEPEVRPIAFKSMLRYWFRAFALGVLLTHDVQKLEAQLFGAINPQTWGWVTVRITQGKVVTKEARPSGDGKNDPCGEQSGVLSLSFSDQAPQKLHQSIETLVMHLTWMMFHLGGIGQGARRPCYSRQNRDRARAPWWRGSTLYPQSDSTFWDIAETVQEFRSQFQHNLEAFYQALDKLSDTPVKQRSPRAIGQVKGDRWVEAVDANCRIVVCGGEDHFSKPYGLATLHQQDLKVRDRQGQVDYDGNLCGQVQGGAKASPVWISDLGDYQVVTIFGASQSPRKDYLEKLRSGTGKNQFAQIWPLK